jgi:hypothetical protein
LEVTLRLTPQHVYGQAKRQPAKVELYDVPRDISPEPQSPMPVDDDCEPFEGARILPFQPAASDGYDSNEEILYHGPPGELPQFVPQGDKVISSWHSGTLHILATFLGCNMHLLNQPSSSVGASIQSVLQAARVYKNIVQSQHLQLVLQDPSPASIMAAHEEVSFM